MLYLRHPIFGRPGLKFLAMALTDCCGVKRSVAARHLFITIKRKLNSEEENKMQGFIS